MRAVGGFPRAKPARRVWVLMRTTSGSGGSLARMVIGVDYSRAVAGSAELPRMKSRAHALGERLLPNHKVFWREIHYGVCCPSRNGVRCRHVSRCESCKGCARPAGSIPKAE